jgi:hypothetical protein
LGAASVNNYLFCETVKNVKSISASLRSTEQNNYGKSHPEGAGGNNLAIWSECGITGSFGVKNIRIIKLPSGEPNTFNLLFDILPPQK